MLARLYSFKFIIGAALLWLGTLAYGLAIYSTQVYRDHAIETQLEMLQSHIKHESHEVTQNLYDKLRLFALHLQSEEPFRQSLGSRDSNAMEDWLAQSYTHYKLSHEQFQLKAILVRDLSGEVFARSNDDDLDSYTGCAEVLKFIGGSLTRLVKPKYSLCSFDNRLLSEVLVPVGSPGPRAYLHIIADAREGLKKLEDEIRMPISVVHGSGKSLYRSSEWSDDDFDTHLYPTYKLYGDDAFLGAEPDLGRLRPGATCRASRRHRNQFSHHYHDRDDYGNGAGVVHVESGLPANEQAAQFGRRLADG